MFETVGLYNRTNEGNSVQLHSQERKLTPTLIFDLLTSNTDPDPDRHQNVIDWSLD